MSGMKTKSGVNLFDYLDYRKFLADYFRHGKEMNPHFSHRLFARKAGLASSGYLIEVSSGDRKITRKKLGNFVKGLELDEREALYFERLVAFTQAGTHRERQHRYELLLQALPPRAAHLKRSQMQYFSKWYYVAVREALAICDVKDRYDVLAAKIYPPLTESQARTAVRALEELGLVERDAKGRWRSRHASLLRRGDEASPVLVRAFQGEMIARAREALETVPQAYRDISSLTMSISADGMRRVKEAVDAFRKHIREIVASDRGEDRVAQLNVQVFPLTAFDGLPTSAPEPPHAID